MKFRDRVLFDRGGVTAIRRDFPSGSVTWILKFVDPQTKRPTQRFSDRWTATDDDAVRWAKAVADGNKSRSEARRARSKPVPRGAALYRKLSKLGFFEGYTKPAVARARKRLEKNPRGFGRWPALALGVVCPFERGLDDEEELRELLRFVASQTFGLLDAKNVPGPWRKYRSFEAFHDLIRAQLRARSEALDIHVPEDDHDDELDDDDDGAARDVSFVIATSRAYDAAARAGLLPSRDSLDDED
jgi:hypothetical protein